MTRAEMRRSKREQEKAQTATYNFTQAQLDALIQEKIGAKLEQSKQEIYEQTVNERSIHSFKDRWNYIRRRYPIRNNGFIYGA